MPSIEALSPKALSWQVAGLCVVLAAITIAVFGQTASFGFVNLDDDVYVYENARVAGGLSLMGVAWVFTHADCQLYHPLTMLSLMGNYQLHGLHAGGYHVTNVLLHTASVILLFLVLRQMTGAIWRSAFVAAVFAIHPLRAESVAWVAERKDVLGAFFFMLTLGAYARYVRAPKSGVRYLMVVAAFLPALLSKPTVVTLPFVLLLLDYWPLRRFEQPGPGWQPAYFGVPRRLIREKIPLLALAAGACAMTVLAGREGIAVRAHVSLPARLGNALVSYVVYLRQMIWPTGLAAFYPEPQKGYAVWTITLSFLLLAMVTGGVLALRRQHRWLLTGWLWYLGMLTPMIGIIQVGAFAHADRNTYLPQIGLYVLLTWAAAELSAAWLGWRVALGGLAAIILFALMACARSQTACWRGNETLWTHALACTTRNDVAHNNLGFAVFKKGRVDEAITHFQIALQCQPGNAQAQNNLGSALSQEGKVDEAIAHFRKALAIQPNAADSHSNLGSALGQKGRLDEAIVHFQRALQLNPDYAEAYYNLGGALGQKGKVDEAISCYQKALQIKPGVPETHYNLGRVLEQKGNKVEAITHYQQALQIKPDYAEVHTRLGIALFQQGRLDEATTHFRDVLQLEPNNADGHYNLGLVFMRQGKMAAAIAEFKTALRLKPEQIAAQKQLADTFINMGKPAEAIPYCEAVVKAEPEDAHAHFTLGSACLATKRLAQAAANFREAVRLAPGTPDCMNALAWIYATSPRAELRNGAEAVRLAEEACSITKRQKTTILDTLAAAYAEAGRFDAAIKTTEEIRALGVSAHDTNTVDTAQRRLELYQARKPYRDE